MKMTGSRLLFAQRIATATQSAKDVAVAMPRKIRGRGRLTSDVPRGESSVRTVARDLGVSSLGVLSDWALILFFEPVERSPAAPRRKRRDVLPPFHWMLNVGR